MCIKNKSTRKLQFVSLLCDTEALCSVFTRLGFKMVVFNDQTADGMRHKVKELGKRNFVDHDALVSNVTHFEVIMLHFKRTLRLNAKLTVCYSFIFII